MDVDEKVLAQLNALKQKFISELPNRIEKIEQAFETWQNQGERADLDNFHRLTHSLTGAGATFGCTDVSSAARELEKYLKALCTAEAGRRASDIKQITRLLDEVKKKVGDATGSDDPCSDNATAQEAQPSTPLNSRHIYLLEYDKKERNNLVVQLSCYGYKVDAFADSEGLLEAVAAQRPSVIIADTQAPSSDIDALQIIIEIQDCQPSPIPIVFYSANPSIAVRLDAVRANGIAYLNKPVRVEEVVDVLDNLANHKEIEPFRILIIDDSPLEAERHSLILQQAGMVTKIVIDPLDAHTALQEFDPELILMDVHMPNCSGLELASVIRQQPTYLGVPIVFLSAEEDRDAQLDAMRHGGDDFLTKPIQAPELKASVEIRAKRYRDIHSMMSRDGLTGLLNHSKIMERYESEFSKTNTSETPLSVAMIDIDHFKQVNDTYGHTAGDSVIKSLARLLLQNLRNSDVVGRYGGEEFFVILTDTTVQDGFNVIERIRASFAKVLHQGPEGKFSATISAGVASLPPYHDAFELRETADKMLYKAKHAGRNRVIAPEQ